MMCLCSCIFADDQGRVHGASHDKGEHRVRTVGVDSECGKVCVNGGYRHCGCWCGQTARMDGSTDRWHGQTMWMTEHVVVKELAVCMVVAYIACTS